MATAPAPAHAVCVFAVRRGRGPELPPDLAGHAGGGPLRLVPAGALWAVVQDVPAHDYSEEALRERLSEPATLERCVRDHHAVVTAFAARGGAIPLPLATLYLSEERCRAALVADVPRFERTLERITGRNEWAVKVNLLAARKLDPQTPQESPARDDEAPAPSGRAYLARLRERGQARDDRRERALAAAELLDRAALSIADATVRRRPHGAEVVGRDRTQILNAAYLVPEPSGSEFTALLDRLRAAPEFEGCEVEVTGPWVPYSFVDAAALAETDDRSPHGSHAEPHAEPHDEAQAGSRPVGQPRPRAVGSRT